MSDAKVSETQIYPCPACGQDAFVLLETSETHEKILGCHHCGYQEAL
jgi:predicted RNA-binding Zn-ribbon protein involved in translation (DUF1610 family)